MFENVLKNSDKIDQKKFHTFFIDYLAKNKITLTSFWDPKDSDLKNCKPYIYFNKLKQNKASKSNLNIILSKINERYLEFLEDNKIIKPEDKKIENVFISRVDELDRIKSFDELWLQFATDPNKTLKDEIEWEYYYSDLRDNILKISNKKNWDEFSTITFQPHIHRIFVADYYDIDKKSDIESFAQICTQIDHLLNIDGKKFKDTGEAIKGKFKAHTEFEKIKSNIYLKQSFLTPVYQQFQRTKIIMIIINVVYRLFLGRKRKLKDYVLENENKALDNLDIDPKNKTKFIKQFLKSTNFTI